MPELLGICDRIYVMNEGRIVGEMPAAEASQEKIMRAIVRAEGRAAAWHRSTETAAQPAPTRRLGARGDLKDNLREYGLLLALVVIMVFFQFMTDGVLFKPVNLTNLILQNSYIIIMALGMLLVIVAGHIDLSVGSVVGFVGARRGRADGAVRARISCRPTLICLVVGGVDRRGAGLLRSPT